MLDSLSCSFTSISFLTTNCFFNLTLRHKLKEQLVVRKDKNVNEHERLSNITLRHKLKKQFVVRKDMDVNEHERLSNITLRHKLKEQLVVFIYILILSYYKLFL
jgi:hypothetical protein